MRRWAVESALRQMEPRRHNRHRMKRSISASVGQVDNSGFANAAGEGRARHCSAGEASQKALGSWPSATARSGPAQGPSGAHSPCPTSSHAVEFPVRPTVPKHATNVICVTRTMGALARVGMPP